MLLDDLLTDRQPDTCSLVLIGIVEPLKERKDLLHIGLVKSDAVIGDGDIAILLAIGSMIAASQLFLGIGWLLLGLAVAWLLVNFGPAVTRGSPLVTDIALMLISPTIGLLMAGVISLRPDHEQLVHKAPTATSGKWIVVVHCRNSEQRDRANRSMDFPAQSL